MSSIIRPTLRQVIAATKPALAEAGAFPWERRGGFAAGAAPAQPTPPAFVEGEDLILSTLKEGSISDDGSANRLVTAWTAGDGSTFAPPLSTYAPKYNPSLSPFLIQHKWDGTNPGKLVSNASLASTKYFHDGTTPYTIVFVWTITSTPQPTQYIFCNQNSTTSNGITLIAGGLTTAGAKQIQVSAGNGSQTIFSVSTTGSIFGNADPIGPHVGIFRLDTVAETWAMRLGGQTVTGVMGAAVPNTGNAIAALTLGTRPNLTVSNFTFIGGIGCFAAKKTYLSDAECATIEAWAVERFGAVML